MSKDPKEPKKSDKKEEKADKADNKGSQIEELTNDLKRVQADFENYKKRVERDNSKLCEYSKADIIKKLLSVLDSFEMALKNTDNHEEFVKGVELIYSQLYTLLNEEGLQHIETVGKRFDPYLHEVLLSEKSDKEDDMILEELQKGYMLKDKVLRHSKVKVAKK
ncbi:MAG: nucleotide exchange factor GrpE [Nanoarchaeota archaeon]|nr:nucleotide exchange factor GrpE [Nanoarchaeota archaeon]